MTHDPSIHSRRVLVDGAFVDATVCVRDGRIDRIEPGSSRGSLDLGDAVLMPGLVDTHVHVNEPGRTHWEGFRTATRAAAAGGITSLVDMPLNCIPVTTSAAALQQKLDAAEGQLHVDCGFWGGVVPGNADALGPLAEAGVLGAKAFLVHSGIDDFPDVGRADLIAGMRALAAAGLPMLVHAELAGAEEPTEGLSPRSYRRYLASRPRHWEDRAVELVVQGVEETGCAAHIVHLSSASSLPILAAARARGLPITAETCPHYLCLHADEVPDGATEFKCAPPIRDAANRDALWQGLADGIIDGVVSDHSPCTPELKQLDTGDFGEAWGGIASLQLGLRSIWTEASERGFGLPELVRWMCERPAVLAGLGDRKGRLAPGFDADLVAWFPEDSFVVQPESLHHRHKVSPWIGRRLRGRVVGTWLRGHRIADEEGPCGAPLGQPLLGRCHE